MRNDWEFDELIPLSEARATLPNRPAMSVIYRWSNKGARGIRLRTVRIGRKMFTTRRWLRAFVEALSHNESIETQAERLGV